MKKLAFTIGETAEALTISVAKVYELIASGGLPIRKIGTRTVVPLKELEQWLAELPCRVNSDGH